MRAVGGATRKPKHDAKREKHVLIAYRPIIKKTKGGNEQHDDRMWQKRKKRTFDVFLGCSLRGS